MVTSRDRISPECNALKQSLVLRELPLNPQNLDGWATIAANLAPYLGNYVRIKFNLFHADAPGNAAAFPTPGWYIDDVTIGERYFSDGIMIIQDIISPQMFMMKNHPDGYGLLFLDAFEPADSELTYTIRNATTGQIAVDYAKATSLEGLTGLI